MVAGEEVIKNAAHVTLRLSISFQHHLLYQSYSDYDLIKACLWGFPT